MEPSIASCLLTLHHSPPAYIALSLCSVTLQSQGQDVGDRVIQRTAAALAAALLTNQQFLPAWGLTGVSTASRTQLQHILDTARQAYAPLLPATDQRLEANWHLYLPWQGNMLQDLEAFFSGGVRWFSLCLEHPIVGLEAF